MGSSPSISWSRPTIAKDWLRGKPRDKAKVEAGVLLAQRDSARLRHQRFFSLEELNAIRPLLAELNQRPFKKLPGSRRSHFESVDPVGAESLAVTPLRICRMEDRHRRDRLPRRSRRSLLLRALSACAAKSRCAFHRDDGGDLRKGERIACHPRAHWLIVPWDRGWGEEENQKRKQRIGGRDQRHHYFTRLFRVKKMILPLFIYMVSPF